MKDIFNDSGHITDYGFELLINGEPTELERLEIAEHLDYCDLCVAEYTKKLENITLLTPVNSVSESVFKQIRNKAVKVFFSRYTMVGIAACMTMIMWVSGVFDISSIEYNNYNKQNVQLRVNRIVNRSNTIFNNMTKSVNEFFDELTNREVFEYEKEK